jgi:hypothetical protein
MFLLECVTVLISEYYSPFPFLFNKESANVALFLAINEFHADIELPKSNIGHVRHFPIIPQRDDATKSFYVNILTIDPISD